MDIMSKLFALTDNNSYKTMKSSSLRIQTLPLKDINYEELPLTLKVLECIKNIKRERILKSMKEKVKIFY